MQRRRLLGRCVAAGLTAVAGCAAPFATDDGAGSDATPTRTADSPRPAPQAGTPLGYTHVRPDGNRLVGDTGSVPYATPVDVPLDFTPEWVVGVARETDVVLVVTGAERVVALRVADDGVERLSLGVESPPGPPLLVGGADLALAPSLGSARTHPVPTTGGWAAVHDDGTVSLPAGENADVGALPDARVVSAAGRLYVLADVTDAYVHGALGDDLEAGSVAVLDPAGGVEATLRPPGGVVEGVAPIVADVDDDGRREVLVTATDADRGARLVALREAGSGPLVGPAIGSGFRWRHQLAVAPFGPEGQVEIAAVKTPHIGGTAEFYRARQGRLELVATLDGYSSHRIRSRNLDGAVAGDFDGDGRVELLVPDDPQTSLAGLRRVEGADEDGDRARGEDGVVEAWRVPLGGRLTTNLCAVAGERGVVVAAGWDAALRVWR